ncbi:MAG: vWA domain-containing protein [Treponema sp.]
MASNLLRKEELVNNPTPRVPICLCLDTSGSMNAIDGDCELTGETCESDGRIWNVAKGGTTRIAELKKGIDLFYNAIRNDETARYSAEICIVTFDNTAKKIVDFSTLNLQEDVPELIAEGYTFMGEGVNLALDLLEERKQEYKEAGVDYYQPWLILMSDGQPEGGSELELRNAQNRTTDLVNSRKLTVFPIGIGQDADKSALEKFSPKFSPLKLQGLKFQEFFMWLSRSVSKTSQSTPGEKVPLDKDGIKNWADIQGWDSLD